MHEAPEHYCNPPESLDPFDNLITAVDSVLLKVTLLISTETLANIHSIT